MNRNKYAISAYYPAEDHDKGVIQYVPVKDDESTILKKLMASGYNPPIAGASRLGKSETVFIIFEDRKVPDFAFYNGVWLRCNLCKNRMQVCKLCYQTGHRSDIYPTPEVKRCPGCGKENPNEDYS
ncbi:hypothetical protein HPB47_023211 [Ixodes persulcatus]|uniref:Uncharacterized protein n=1 Tax=Ixodes persulcatus TaxID=34615 RepID=A0AC60Q834_IXOPE|nr:hypothetical protein HPB47_023211 [Ixodes persulcatus]